MAEDFKVLKDFPLSATVACQGIAGAFSETAAERLFKIPNLVYVAKFKDVFKVVDNGHADYGILPIENSNAGSVTEVYDLFKSYKFFIVSAVKLPVEHNLLGIQNTKIEDIKEIYTHHMAEKQCSKFLEHHPNIKVILSPNTAESAKFVSNSGRKDIASISSKKCANIYNLSTLKQNIQDSDNNRTRFICISKKFEVYENANKISIMLTLEHKAGALFNIIKLFAENGLNLTKLESRPIMGSDFEFMFYFDLEGNLCNKTVRNLIKKLKTAVPYFLLLGNYKEL